MRFVREIFIYIPPCLMIGLIQNPRQAQMTGGRTYPDASATTTHSLVGVVPSRQQREGTVSLIGAWSAVSRARPRLVRAFPPECAEFDQRAGERGDIGASGRHVRITSGDVQHLEGVVAE